MSSASPDLLPAERLSATVCFLCRQRKTKCDRRRPRCGFCVKAKADCRYLDQPKKRGLRAGYVTELESRIEVLESQVQNLQSATRPADRMISRADTQAQAPVHSPSHASPHPTFIPAASVTRSDDFIEGNAAIADMMTFPQEYFQSLVDIWFKETHMWVPIINREQIQSCLNTLPNPVDRIDDIVLRAVICTKVAYSSQAICLGYRGRRRLSMFLRSQVIVEAMSRPCFKSLQALLIVALLDYGCDDISSTFSLMAICRRMSENIGLFRQLLTQVQEESNSTTGSSVWSSSGDGETAVPLIWCILAFDSASSLGTSWRDASAALADQLSSIASLTPFDYRDAFRTHVHFAAIGLQPVHEFLYARRGHQHADADEATLATCDVLFQDVMVYVHGVPETNYKILENGAIDFDICHMFTRALAHATTVLIYQPYALDEADIDQVAKSRCLNACDQLANIVRSMSDADVEINSPVLSSIWFIAARFRLILDRALTQQREPMFDILMHGINMTGRRWPLARRYDIALRAAMVEVDTGTSHWLPLDFWDMKKTFLEISEVMKGWVNEYKSTLYVGSLNGPYV